MDVRREARQIFLGKVRKTTRCWEWQGHVGNHGYGVFHFRGQRVLAHRYSFQLFKGEIPKGHQVRHKCDNPICVRPGHLLTGTHKDNARDAVERNRLNPWNSRKTHCPRGHLLDERTTTQRRCSICRRAAYRRWWEKTHGRS